MSAIETSNQRVPIRARTALQRRAAEWFVLAATSLAFLFSLGIAFGLISG